MTKIFIILAMLFILVLVRMKVLAERRERLAKALEEHIRCEKLRNSSRF